MHGVFDSSWYSAQGGTGTDEMLVHSRLFPHVRSLEQDQNEIHYQNMLNVRLYTNREMMAFDWNDANVTQYSPLDANLENVIQSVCDTLVSRVGKMRPKATPVARGARFKTYLKVRQLDRYLWGEFQYQDIHQKAESCFLDALIFGTGIMKVDVDGDEIFTERVCPDEIIVDQRECVSSCEPMQLHHRRLVSRLWLLKTYGDDPEMAVAIKAAQQQNFIYTTDRNPSQDQIVIIESWKLPTRKGGDDGRHTICIENATLEDEPYKRNRFPFAFFRWNPPKHGGFYGRSLVEDLTGYQIRLNELNDVIREGQDRMCVPRVFLDQGAGITGTKFDNTVGRLVYFRGTPPIVDTWSAFNPEIYNERDRIKQSAFEFAGVSQFSAQNKLPTQARLDSSAALREYNAIEDERFNHQAQGYEKFFLDIAEHIVELSAELYKNKVSRKNTFKSNNLAMEIDWKDVNLDRDRYVLQISASSIINMTPAARKDLLNEWAAAGVITQEQYKAWSGQPDLEKMVDLMSAPMDFVQRQIDQLLDGRRDVTPDPFSNLNEGYKMVVDTYLHLEGTLEDVPEDILQGFRDWLELAKEIIQPTQIQSAIPQGAPMGAPMGDPMMGGAPPTDPMMPPVIPPGAPTNQMTGAPAPAVATPAAQAFVGL